MRDGESTLAEALGSILGQTDPDFEAIVVDDGSVDRTLAVARDLAARDPRVRVVEQARLGLVAALEAARAHARGRYLLRMDADDVALPTRLALQRRVADEDESTSVVSCLVSSFGDVALGRRQYDAWLNAHLSHDAMARVRFVESPVAHPSVLLRASAVARVGGYRDTGGPEDWDLWLRLFQAGERFAKVPRVLLRWREHEHRVSRTDARYGREAFIATRAHHLARGPLAGVERVILVGAGKAGHKLAKALARESIATAFFVDVAARVGRTRLGVPVLAVDELVHHRRGEPVLGVASARGARAEIRASLLALGLVEGRDFNMAA